MPLQGCLISFITGTEGQFILEATVEKAEVIEWFQSTLKYQLLSQLLGDKNLGLVGDNPLWCGITEGSNGKLVVKEKTTFSFK